MAATPTIGVVIVTFNSVEIIRACLASIRPAASRPLQVVVIDNASSDGTANLVAADFPEVTLIRSDTNRYYAAASNQGLSAIESEFVLLLNPDTVLPEGGVDLLAGFLESRPDAAAVAPMLVNPGGTRQPSLRELPGLDTLWYDLLGLSFLFSRSRVFGRWRMGYFEGSGESVVEQPMASCLLVRRRAFDRIGWFDESYPMFFNDVDWCRRAKEAGMPVWYTPLVRVIHLGGATVRRYKLKMIWMSHSSYFRYLSRLHRKNPIKSLLVFLSWPPLMLAALARSAFWWLRRG